MSYFNYDEKTNTLETSFQYWIPVSELSDKLDGRYFWFYHLVQKNWFTENVCNELIDWCRKLKVDIDYDTLALEIAEDRSMINVVNKKMEGLL